jgi:RNA polymerase sigma-70 factor (ECF subfamily)
VAAGLASPDRLKEHEAQTATAKGLHPMERPTPDLLDSYRRGRSSAYDLLFSRYRAPLLRFIRARTDAVLRRHAGEEDLLQETHVEALRSIDRFTYRSEHAFFFWLCRIAARRVYHQYRQLRRRPPPVSVVPPTSAGVTSQDLVATLAAPGPDPERILLLREHLDLVATALEALPDAYREAILIRRVEGYGCAEAARFLGITPNALSIRLSRGLAQLSGILATLLEGREAERPA